jgi:hypothetical protein
MPLTRCCWRRLGILLALLLPALLVFHGSNPVDAQFPKGAPGGFKPPSMPKPPTFPKMPGPTVPGGPLGPPGFQPPGALPGLEPPGAGPLAPPGFQPPGARPGLPGQDGGPGGPLGPGGPFVGPPGAFGPPGPFPPPNPFGPAPGAAPPPVELPPQAFVPLDPPAAPAQAFFPVLHNVVANPQCRFCHAEITPGDNYCTRCKLTLFALFAGGGLMAIGVLLVPAIIIVWLLYRGRH